MPFNTNQIQIYGSTSPLAGNLLVSLNASGLIAPCVGSSSDEPVGVTFEQSGPNNLTPVALLTSGQVALAASGPIAVGVPVYSAAGGYATASTGGLLLGTSTVAAIAPGYLVTIQPTFGLAGNGGGGTPSPETALNWITYGADPTGVADSAAAINECHAAAAAAKLPIRAPAGTYKVLSSIMWPVPSIVGTDDYSNTIYMEGATVVASASGTYNQVKNGAGTNLGIFVIFDNAYTNHCHFVGTLTITGVNGQNHVGLASSVQNTGYVSSFDVLTINTCEFGLYGATNGGVNTNGSLVGCFFRMLSFTNCDTSFYQDLNQDDILIGVLRTTSNYGTQAQVTINDYCHVGSFYINGGSASKDGIAVGFGSLTADIVLLEGTFNNAGVVVESSGTCFTCKDLRVSPTYATTSSKVGIYVGTANGMVDVAINPQTANTSSSVLQAIVGLYNQGTTSSRNIRVRLPWAVPTAGQAAPFVILGGGDQNADQLVTEANGQAGTWNTFYTFDAATSASVFGNRRLIPNFTGLQQYDDTGAYQGVVQIMGALTISGITNGGTYQVDDQIKPSSLVVLDAPGSAPAAGFFQISLFAGNPNMIGKLVTLVALTNPIQIAPSTTVKFGNGLPFVYLGASRLNSVTLMWDGTYWNQVAASRQNIGVGTVTASANGQLLVMNDAPANYQILEVTVGTAGWTLQLYDGDATIVGIPFTIAAVTNGFTLGSTATSNSGHCKYANGETTRTIRGSLAADPLTTGNYCSITLMWDGSYWIEVASTILSGTSNVVTPGQSCAVIGGLGCLANSFFGMCGGYNGKNDKVASWTRGIGSFGTQGDSQEEHIGWYGYTGGGVIVATEIFSNGSNSRNGFTANGVWDVYASVVCIDAATYNVASFAVRFTVKCVSGTASIVGSVTTVAGNQSDSALSTAAIAFGVTGANLTLKVTGVSGYGLNWTARAQTTVVLAA
jgi:hypothetical protein